MSATLVRCRPFSASTPVAAASRSWRVRSRRRSKRLPGRARDAEFITELIFTYVDGRVKPLGREVLGTKAVIDRDRDARGRRSETRFGDQNGLGTVFDGDGWRLAVDDESNEGVERFAHRRDGFPDGERRPLEAARRP